SAAVIDGVSRTKHFMRVRDEEGSAASSAKSLLKVFLSLCKIVRLVKICSCHVCLGFAVPRLSFQDLLELRDGFIIFLAIDKVPNFSQIFRGVWCLTQSGLVRA